MLGDRLTGVEVYEYVVRKQKERMEMRVEMRKGMDSKESPDCSTENTLKWITIRSSYQEFCPEREFDMTLCGQCTIDNHHSCDWNVDKGFCYHTLEEFWKNLKFVSFKEDDNGRLVLANDYRFMVGNIEIAKFLKGTHREEIADWFDENYPKGVEHLLDFVENKMYRYFSIEDGNGLQIGIEYKRENAIRKCKENPEARKVVTFLTNGKFHQPLSCVFNKEQ